MTVVSKNAMDIEECAGVKNIFGWKGRDNGIKLGVGEGKRLGESACKIDCSIVCFFDAVFGKTNHLGRLIYSNGEQAMIKQEALKVSGARTDFQYFRSLNEWSNCSCPVIPATNGYDRRDEIIGPGKGMIKVMEEKPHEARDQAHEIQTKQGFDICQTLVVDYLQL